MIGPPGCGKSTWIKNYLKNKSNNYTIISRDDIVVEVGEKNKISYNEMFNPEFSYLQRQVNKILQQTISSAISGSKSIIVDMTNMSKKSRSGILNKIDRNEFETKAVSFEISKERIIKQIEKRFKETGKNISFSVLISMMNNYEPPTKDEFDFIEIIKD